MHSLSFAGDVFCKSSLSLHQANVSCGRVYIAVHSEFGLGRDVLDLEDCCPKQALFWGVDRSSASSEQLASSGSSTRYLSLKSFISSFTGSCFTSTFLVCSL